MNSIWKSLLWKEWREQRWRLVALTAFVVSLVFAIVGFHAYIGRGARDSLEFYVVLSSLAYVSYVILAGVFAGMSVAASETSHDTMRFLQALPTSMQQVAIAKLAVCLASVLIPILLMSVCLYGKLIYSWGGPSGIKMELLPSEEAIISIEGGIFNWYSMRTITGSIAVGSVLLWMLAGGVNRSDEVRAGAIGFLVCGGVWLLSLCLFDIVKQVDRAWGDVLKLFAVMLPAGPAFLPSYAEKGLNSWEWMLMVSALLLSHGAVLDWFLKRFGRVAVPPKRSDGFELDLSRWWKNRTEPMHSQWQAIAWKQLRETGPLAVLAAVCILSITTVVYYIDTKNRWQTDFGEILASLSISVGFFVVLVSGIGVFLEDFAPGLNNFWRSRPISVTQWFLIKILTGLAGLTLAFGGLLLLAYNSQKNFEFKYDHEFLVVALFSVYAVVIFYSLGVASYCLLRQPIYAAVLTIVVFLCGIMSLGWWFPNTDHAVSASIVMFITLAIPITIAYLAIKHDWGWKVGR